MLKNGALKQQKEIIVLIFLEWVCVPYGLVVRIRRSHRRGPGSIPGVGTYLFSFSPHKIFLTIVYSSKIFSFNNFFNFLFALLRL